MKTQLYQQTLFVSLGSEIDTERFMQMSSNEKSKELHKPTEFIYFQVNNLLDAKLLSEKFIQTFNLGGSNWIGGRVIDADNNFVARISYNGRIWDNEDWKISNEIEIC